MKHFIDNSIAPIIAIDFDGTICTGDSYPNPNNGELRPYAKEVINLLHSVGVKIVIWTNRKNIPDTDVKDKLLMKQWLDDKGIWYHTVNDSTEFAPFKYYGRKLYAHMFVDDRGFGFDCDDDEIMLKVLQGFLVDIIDCPWDTARRIVMSVQYGPEPDYIDIDEVKDIIKNWNKGDTDA